MLKCIDPATGEVIERICCDDRRTVHRTFGQLNEGQRDWWERGWEQRAEILADLGEMFDDQRVRLVGGLTGEVGTPIRQARAEVEAARRRIQGFIDAGKEAMRDEVLRDEETSREIVEREPLGTVAHISTWSFPCLVGVEVMVPALLAGNTVLYKPSEHAALVGRELVHMMWEAGVPEDAIDIVIGDGAVGDYVLDESISGLSFAGTYNTGQMVAQKLATRMIPQQLELGSKDGAYVCEDVDVEQAARQVADAAYYNSGRGRRAFDRVYVHESVHRPFTDALCRFVDSFALGDPGKEANFVGPVVDDRSIRTLEYQISDAVQKGARLLLGGRARGGKGHFFEPTVVVDADHRMLVMREESPGPVVAIQRVCDDHEALHRLGDSDYGGCASMFSQNRKRARDMLKRLDAESVFWSGCYSGDGQPPVSAGAQPSGLDISSQADRVRRFTRPKNWTLGAQQAASGL